MDYDKAITDLQEAYGWTRKEAEEASENLRRYLDVCIRQYERKRIEAEEGGEEFDSSRGSVEDRN